MKYAYLVALFCLAGTHAPDSDKRLARKFPNRTCEQVLEFYPNVSIEFVNFMRTTRADSSAYLARFNAYIDKLEHWGNEYKRCKNEKLAKEKAEANKTK